MVHHCIEAARELLSEGVSAEIVDLRTVRPIDSRTVLDSVRKTGKALIVHEDTKAGGMSEPRSRASSAKRRSSTWTGR